MKFLKLSSRKKWTNIAPKRWLLNYFNFIAIFSPNSKFNLLFGWCSNTFDFNSKDRKTERQKDRRMTWMINTVPFYLVDALTLLISIQKYFRQRMTFRNPLNDQHCNKLYSPNNTQTDIWKPPQLPMRHWQHMIIALSLGLEFLRHFGSTFLFIYYFHRQN